ncbi:MULTISPECIES: stage III sporulation protein AE [Bacillus]|uniref:Stage III sporulation protein AE n=1 Tax=Bacillus pseudomycoides TaxID=64104 RepID=A0A2C0W606_9BACI|nr:MULTISPECIES: stage III sporulation protein AE [Bacillus]EEM09562.1 Stage III sporulation protein AE [Bacillus pseudomycoides]EEM15433.1 Stage III sporulation protein AE [Bacillus pseudomycoides DSM 12442]KFN16779.1 stage III sporulation protein AE [Bacillus pseudomycoides]MBD5796615.1 stage III sporulation protein AE [Bacillus pseudomycoides]MBJ8030209.1 stage III sporulation protein AE [Bacillus cereus group sp. N21]
MLQRFGAKLLFACFLFFSLPIVVQASPVEKNVVDQQLDKLGIEDVKQFWDGLVTKYGGYLPESQKGSFMEFVKGEKEFSIKEWMIGLLKYLFHELVANGKLLGTLIMLTIFSALLQSLQSAFSKSSISKIADAVVYMVLIIFALNSFYVVMTYARETIQTMVDFILALLPILLALIATGGGVVSVSFFHPIIIFLMNTSGLLMNYIVLPLLLLATILSIVSTMSDQYKVTKLSKLLQNVSVGIIGIFLTVFLGVLSVQGTATAVADGIAVKTAKFVTGNFIPVVGRMFTEAADTVISASGLLKNTVGIIGLVILCLIVAFPAIQIFCIAFIYKFAAAVLQPVGGGAIIKCLDIIGRSIIYVFACLAIVSFMFFLSITIIIAAGNITLMMR